MCKARIPMSYVTLKEKLVWWPTKQIMKCYIWLCPSILPKYKLPPYPHPHPPIPVPPISNIPMLKVRDLTYSKAFHAWIEKQVKKNAFLWLSRQIITLKITLTTLCEISEVNLLHKISQRSILYTKNIFHLQNLASTNYIHGNWTVHK